MAYDQDDDVEKHEFKKCNIVASTDAALRVQLSDGKLIWVPKSVVHDDSEIWKSGEQGTLTVAGWWAVKHKHA